jgi:hypothetical protein
LARKEPKKKHNITKIQVEKNILIAVVFHNLKNHLAEEGSNLKLMWVSAYVGMKGNERADNFSKRSAKPGG